MDKRWKQKSLEPGANRLGRTTWWVAALVAILVWTPLAASATDDFCDPFRKQVSVDGGAFWSDADNEATAPIQAIGGAVQYRFIVKNCGEQLCIDTYIDDPALGLTEALIPGSQGPGILQPGEEVIVTQSDDGFKNLAQSCDTPGFKYNGAFETSTIVDEKGDPVVKAVFADAAFVNCGETCGNKVVEPDLGETCDPPGTVPGTPPGNSNACRDDCTYCGDGIVNDGEECDDPNDPTCSNDCKLIPFCGNGIVDPGETCDPPGSIPDLPPGNQNACRESCTYCGDGIPNNGEECDDPNDPACSNTCELLGCDIEVDKFCTVLATPGGPACDDIKKITSVSMIWDGPSGVNVSTPSGTFSGLDKGDEISFSTPTTDTVVKISGAVTGSSTFHVSCSDEDMDGPEDCGTPQGNGKKNDGGLNLWLFEGMTGEKGSFDCTVPPGDPATECTIVASKNTSKKKKKKAAPSGGTSDDVEYTYVIRNVGSSKIFDTTVIDDQLGEIGGSPIDLLEPNGEVTLKQTVQDVASTVTNTVFVSGATAAGQVCEADASVTVTVESPPATCDDGKPVELVFEVVPGPCSASSNGQGTKFLCSGEPVGAPFAVVGPKVSVTPASVGANETVSVKPLGDKFDSNTELQVIGANGTQTLSIHTSCSQPLNVGDRFGSLILKVFVPGVK
jgi:hypothetical protein